MDATRIADANLVACYSYVVGRTGELLDAEGVTCARSGSFVPDFNAAFVTGPLDDAHAALSAAVAFFDEADVPFVVQVREGADPHVEAAAAALGLRRTSRMPGMVLDPLDAPPTPPDGLEVHDVGPDGMADYNRLLDRAFGLPDGAAATLFAPEHADGRTLFPLVGTVEGQAVTASALVLVDGIAGIYNVATLPAHRRRGFGEAMTWAAIARGAERGADVATLQSSSMGLPIYERMGFRTVATYATYARA